MGGSREYETSPKIQYGDASGNRRRCHASPMSAPNLSQVKLGNKKGPGAICSESFFNHVSHHSRRGAEELPDQDSNLDKQNQNLLC